MSMKPVNSRGVTLIELVIVFLIIAIMAGLLVPNIGAWLLNYRLRGAARDIVSIMRTAQLKAVSNNTQFRINLNEGDVGLNSYVLQYYTVGTWVNESAIQSLPPGIKIIANTFPGKYANFNPNYTSSAGSVTLQNKNGATKRISLTSSTGRVNIN
jgi:Tfp pilus assembly protein FimT